MTPQLIVSKYKIALILLVAVGLIVAGIIMLRSVGTSDTDKVKAACLRSSQEIPSVGQGISADAAICNGSMKPGNPQ